MAPGVLQNSETILNGPLDAIASTHNGDLIKELMVGESPKSCPIEHFELINGSAEEAKEEKKEIKKPVRKVVRPKVLKNHESHDYLYDRLYDDTCPRVVSNE